MKPSQQSTSSTSVAFLTTPQQVASWSQKLTLLHQRIAPRFARSEPRQRVLAFLRGLLSTMERKTSWQLAEHARQATPYGMQRLLGSAVWDVEGLRDDVRTYALEQLGTTDALLALDETSFPKPGQHSAGVKAQWCGSTGQVENCQVGVFLTTATTAFACVHLLSYLPLNAAEASAHPPLPSGFDRLDQTRLQHSLRRNEP